MRCNGLLMRASSRRQGSPSSLHRAYVGFRTLVGGGHGSACRRCDKKAISTGGSYFHAGAAPREMFLIKAGRVKLTKVTEDGEEMTLDIRRGGDFIGENMLNEEVDYPVTAVCVEDTLTCGFSKAKFEQLILERPTIGLQVIKNLSRRIDSLTSRIGDMSMTSLEERLQSPCQRGSRARSQKRCGTQNPFPADP